MVGMSIDMDFDPKLEILGFGRYGLWTYSGILEIVEEWLIASGGEPLWSIVNIFVTPVFQKESN